MNPVGGIFGITFASLEADAQPDLFTFVGTCLDGVVEGNRFSLWAIKQRGLMPQGFQLGYDLFDTVGHLKKRLRYRGGFVGNRDE